ncbi:MAG: alpha/beta fold hydrolase [Pseudomonadota bacterium]
MRAKLPHTTGVVDRDGIGIHYEVYGEGEHTILFLPTWSLVHSRIYKAQIPYFSDHFKVVAYDPRGNGKSDRPATKDGYTLDHSVADAVAVMDATRTDKASIFGLSYSGLVGAALAANHPERVSAFIAISANTPLVPPYEYRKPEAFNAKRETHEGWDKYNRYYWPENYADFSEFFNKQIFTERHSTKQIEDGIAWSSEGDGEMLVMTIDSREKGKLAVNEDMYRKIKCPVLLIHGEDDAVAPTATSKKIAELTDSELHTLPGAGHAANARFPAKVNTLMRDFLAKSLGTWRPQKAPSKLNGEKRALYLSSPIGLGHGRRDIAVTRELRKLHPDLKVDWLAQDPVTRLLEASGETVHPASGLLASESAHIEAECGEHDLHAFQAIRSMDEILIRNFMVFQEVVEQQDYDLVIADEAWDVDHYWHEHPELKKSKIAWFTDFVGWVPMPEGGAREAFLTSDYNEEMIGHIESHPELRDRSIFVGAPEDIVPMSFGKDLPMMRDWVPKHFEFSGYIIGQHPSEFDMRDDLRREFGYQPGEKVCIVTVGGSGVGNHLIRRILQAYPIAKRQRPELRMIVITGPRIDPASLNAPADVELMSFVPDLDRRLAACDLAVVQGGLTTCMELAAAGTPFLYFPLRNHFEQNFHVAHRLDRYGAGRRMSFADSNPDQIAAAMVEELTFTGASKPVESDGARRAAAMLADLL